MERVRSAIQKAKVAREQLGIDATYQPELRPRDVREQEAAAATGGTAPAGTATGASPSPLPGGKVAHVWNEMDVFTPKPKLMTANRVVTFDQKDPAHVAYDMMRTKILSNCRANNWRTVAITSPTAECGKTLTAINLAFSFARHKDTRTVLMDLDLRRPMVAETLGITAPHSMGRFLEGEDPVDMHFLRYNQTLAIGSNNRRILNAAEVLQHANASAAMDLLKSTLAPDIILVDLPPMLATDDVMAFLPNVDAVLLVAGAGASTLREVDDCERDLAEQTDVMGVVLNKCEYGNESYSYSYG